MAVDDGHACGCWRALCTLWVRACPMAGMVQWRADPSLCFSARATEGQGVKLAACDSSSMTGVGSAPIRGLAKGSRLYIFTGETCP